MKALFVDTPSWGRLIVETPKRCELDTSMAQRCQKSFPLSLPRSSRKSGAVLHCHSQACHANSLRRSLQHMLFGWHSCRGIQPILEAERPHAPAASQIEEVRKPRGPSRELEQSLGLGSRKERKYQLPGPSTHIVPLFGLCSKCPNQENHSKPKQELWKVQVGKCEAVANLNMAGHRFIVQVLPVDKPRTAAPAIQ